jgi:hypothetical protein
MEADLDSPPFYQALSDVEALVSILTELWSIRAQALLTRFPGYCSCPRAVLMPAFLQKLLDSRAVPSLFQPRVPPECSAPMHVVSIE